MVILFEVLFMVERVHANDAVILNTDITIYGKLSGFQILGFAWNLAEIVMFVGKKVLWYKKLHSIDLLEVEKSELIRVVPGQRAGTKW